MNSEPGICRFVQAKTGENEYALSNVERALANIDYVFAILHAFGIFVADVFQSRCRLEAENPNIKRGRRIGPCDCEVAL